MASLLGGLQVSYNIKETQKSKPKNQIHMKFRIDACLPSSNGVISMVPTKREGHCNSIWDGGSKQPQIISFFVSIFNIFPSKVLNPLGGGVIYFLSRMVVKSKGESKRKKSPTKNTLVPQVEIQGDHLPTAPQWQSLVICSNVEFDKVNP